MRLRRFAQSFMLALAMGSFSGARPAADTVPPVLDFEGDHFTVDGTPKFLLFVSYFDAVRRAGFSPGTLGTDLDFFKTRVDGIRIFPNWWDYGCPSSVRASDGLFNPNGTINEARWSNLVTVLNEAGNRDLLVDVSFSRETIAPNGLDENVNHDRIVDITNRMKDGFPHVYFDLQNEWDNGNISEAGIRSVAAAVATADPDRIITVSGGFLNGAGLDVAAVHDRGDGWFGFSRINGLIQDLRHLNPAFTGPVHFQEPMPFTQFCRNNIPDQVHDGTKEHHKEAARNARAAGAAAWTLHSRTAFDLESTTTFENLANADTVDPDQVVTLSELRGGLTQGNACWGAQGVRTVSPASVQVGATASPGSLQAADNGACTSTLTGSSDVSWITNLAIQGSSLSFSVSDNLTPVPRIGHITFAGRVVPVTQAAGARVPNDFNHDGLSDLGVFRPSLGRFLITGQADTVWGLPGDMPVAGDFNGDGNPDIAVFRPANGTWYINGVATISFGWPGDIPVPGDYDGNGITDIAVFRPSTGTFFIRNGATVTWGLAGDLPVIGDYNGDGSDDIAVYRPSNGMWYVRNIMNTQFGLPADIPVPADYNGDGITDVAVFRPATGTWFVNNQFTESSWGLSGDVPVPLDRDGDHRADLGVFRRANGTWYFKNHTTGNTESVGFGVSGDVPLGRAMPPVRTPWGDYDGDRKADLTVFRPSTGDWVSLRSTNMTDYTQRSFGWNGDVPVGRDYDGDGKVDFAVYRPSLGRWFVLQSSTDATVTQDWGLSDDTPVPADYDGDGRADFAVFRPSLNRWLIRLSSTYNTSYAQHDWGLAGDLPVPADYDGDGRADVAVFRPSSGQWFILNRFTGAFVVHDWGLPGDAAAAADFDGDGKADLAVFRPSLGRWFIKSSIDGSPQLVDWGLNGDILVPADYDGDGKADVAVYRPSNGRWYVRGLFDRDWGVGGDIPALRNP